MSNETRFWNKHAEKYALRPVADPETYEKKLEITRAYLRPDAQVLEMGCGTGSTALAHAPYVQHILATDVSDRMIEIARRKAAAANIENVSFETCEPAEYDLGDSRFDVIMAHNLLHLLRDPAAAIAAAYRALKPGGAFVSSTACIGDMAWYFRLIAPLGQFLRLFPLVQVFSQAELRRNLVAAGFEIDQEWLPKRNAAVFMIAIKRAPGEAGVPEGG